MTAAAAFASALALGLAPPAAAPAPAAPGGLTAAELSRVGVRPPPGARAPMELALRDGAGRPASLASAGAGRPLVLVFADYACTSLCGPALSVTAARLGDAGLDPGRDYRLAVLGLDPASTPLQARAFGEARLPPGSLLARAATLTVGPGVAAVARALGYGYAYDPRAHQFAHPVAAFVLTPDGRLAAVLGQLDLTAPALREAVEAAGRGRETGLVDRLALICHGALVAVGRYDGSVVLGLRAGGVLTLLALAGGWAWLAVRRRRTAA